jgi:hypothetical protein
MPHQKWVGRLMVIGNEFAPTSGFDTTIQVYNARLRSYVQLLYLEILASSSSNTARYPPGVRPETGTFISIQLAMKCGDQCSFMDNYNASMHSTDNNRGSNLQVWRPYCFFSSSTRLAIEPSSAKSESKSIKALTGVSEPSRKFKTPGCATTPVFLLER